MNKKDSRQNKSFLAFPFEVKEIEEDGIFRGYGSTFGGLPDAHGDIVAKGAYVKSLAKGGRNGNGIPMLWQHKSDQIPGVWTELAEDSRGLRSVGKLAMRTSLGKDVYETMKLGFESKSFGFGLSIGYDVVDHEPGKEKGTRLLKEIDLWELSIVTFPANINARIETVKTLNPKLFEEAGTERELERSLRDAGCSRSFAQFLVKLYKPYLREADEGRMSGATGLSEVLRILNQANAGYQSSHLDEEDSSGMLEILKTLKQVNS